MSKVRRPYISPAAAETRIVASSGPGMNFTTLADGTSCIDIRNRGLPPEKQCHTEIRLHTVFWSPWPKYPANGRKIKLQSTRVHRFVLSAGAPVQRRIRQRKQHHNPEQLLIGIVRFR